MARASSKGIVWVVIGLGLVALVLGLLTLGLVPFGFPGAPSVTEFEDTTRHPDVAVVRFDLDNAELHLRVGGDEVVVERRTLRGTPSEEVSGDTLVLDFDCPTLAFNCRSTYMVTVPAGTALEGGVANGGIVLDDVDGPVELALSNGSIEAGDVTSEVLVLRTSNGAIIGTGLTSPAVDVRTSNGRIELAFVEPPRSVMARTSNGSISVVVPDGSPPYAVEATTSNGRTDIDIDTDPSAAVRMEVTTSNGSILVAYGD